MISYLYYCSLEKLDIEGIFNSLIVYFIRLKKQLNNLFIPAKNTIATVIVGEYNIDAAKLCNNILS